MNSRRDRGWLTFKRPGVEKFLEGAFNLGWEVVLYTDQDHMTAEPVMERIDPGRRYVPFRLFRDSTNYTGGLLRSGVHCRDLSKLNRDLKKVLYLTWDTATGQMQPDNTVQIAKWEGDAADTQLLDMIPVLQMITSNGVEDVRAVARAYKGTNLPNEFKQRARARASKQGGGDRKGWFGK